MPGQPELHSETLCLKQKKKITKATTTTKTRKQGQHQQVKVLASRIWNPSTWLFGWAETATPGSGRDASMHKAESNRERCWMSTSSLHIRLHNHPCAYPHTCAYTHTNTHTHTSHHIPTYTRKKGTFVTGKKSIAAAAWWQKSWALSTHPVPALLLLPRLKRLHGAFKRALLHTALLSGV